MTSALAGKRVFITGHTGFKGSWAVAQLHAAGAVIGGYALEPPTDPSLFSDAGLESLCAVHTIGDIRDVTHLTDSLHDFRPELVLHLAAQPLVSDGYRFPRDTWDVNTQGTVNLLEAVRSCPSVQGVVAVTTDKVYEPSATSAHVETDRLGGHDNYAASKAAAELAIAAYRASYWSDHGPIVASARAGNVIGGGDWAPDRLVADAARAAMNRTQLVLRRPDAVRPWQHVQDAILGYILLLERMTGGDRSVARAWNFGPDPRVALKVGDVIRIFNDEFGIAAEPTIEAGEFEENPYLTVNASDAEELLGWQPRRSAEEAVRATARWYAAFAAGELAGDLIRAEVAVGR